MTIADLSGPIVLIVLVGLIGLVIYWVIHPAKHQEPIILDAYPKRANVPWYAAIFYLLGLAPWLFFQYIFKAGTYAPVIGGLIGLAFFLFICLANWYKPLRKRMNYWLTLQSDERLAAAWAEPTLYALNGFFVFTSGILVTLACYYFFG